MCSISSLLSFDHSDQILMDETENRNVSQSFHSECDRSSESPILVVKWLKLIDLSELFPSPVIKHLNCWYTCFDHLLLSRTDFICFGRSKILIGSHMKECMFDDCSSIYPSWYGQIFTLTILVVHEAHFLDLNLNLNLNLNSNLDLNLNLNWNRTFLRKEKSIEMIIESFI